MTDQDLRFMAAILAEPASEVHKLAYADWLRDQSSYYLTPAARERRAAALVWMARRGKMFYVSPQQRSTHWIRQSYSRSIKVGASGRVASLPRSIFECLPRGCARWNGARCVEKALDALASALDESRRDCADEGDS